MARVHFVEKARKDNPVCKKGESYYHWTPFRSPTRYSKTYPRPSQTCGGKKSQILAAQEGLSDALGAISFEDAEQAQTDLQSAVEDCASQFREIADEYRDSVQNMPEGLQQGEQAQNMEDQADGLESAADEMENVTVECDVDREDHTDEDDNFDKDGYQEACDNWLSGVVEEIQSASDSVELLF
jgi:hypothetical protein